MNRMLDVTSSFAASLARVATGMRIGRLGRRPDEPLRLYDFEACPYCRKAREALTVLDLDVMIYPCPKGGPHYREELIQRGGKAQFPYLVDPNTGKEMYESDTIVAYLFQEYGVGGVPMLLSPGPLTDASAMLASAVRPVSGRFYSRSRVPAAPLELYSFEASPYCRIVRETLTSLEISYLLHNVAKGSPRRKAFIERSGKMRVPYLVDSNTGVAMFESAEISRYLVETYGETA